MKIPDLLHIKTHTCTHTHTHTHTHTCIKLIATKEFRMDEEIRTTLGGNKTIRYNLLIPVIGVTVKVCITGGHVHVYGSVSIPNPNSAFNDFSNDLKHESNNETCCTFYVDSCPANQNGRPRRQTSESDSSTQIVYISIVGMAQESSFIVNGTAGNIYQATPFQNIPDFIAMPTPPESKPWISVQFFV